MFCLPILVSLVIDKQLVNFIQCLYEINQKNRQYAVKYVIGGATCTVDGKVLGLLTLHVRLLTQHVGLLTLHVAPPITYLIPQSWFC